MDYAYLYGDPHRLYLNVTNRCTNRCLFCIRNGLRGLGGADLRGADEPDEAAVLSAIERLGGPGAFREIIWCGFGEPVYRLDLILSLSGDFRRAGARVRLNTNGHGTLIHGRDILPDLGKVLDEVSVSLNAPNAARYVELCRPVAQLIPAGGACAVQPEVFWAAACAFIAAAPAHVSEVQASVVGGVLDDIEIEESRALAAALGAHRFRVR